MESHLLRYLMAIICVGPLRRSKETTSKRPLRSLREHDALAPRDRHWWRSCRGSEPARWPCPPLSRCGIPSTARPPSSPWLCVWSIWAGTPGQLCAEGTTSASLSHLPSHASPSQIENLVSWTLTPSRSSSALFSVRPVTPSRRPREQNEEQTDDYFGDRPRVSGRPLPLLASLRARAP